jgi:ATP-dependent protease ClpP protease subunit
MAAGPDNTVSAVVNSSPEEGVITIYDVIRSQRYYPEDTSSIPDDVLKVVDSHNKDIEVRINSRGGAVDAALLMSNSLKRYNKGRVTTIVEGYAFSAAGVLAQSGSVRKICKGGIFMIHNPRLYPEISSLAQLESVGNNWLAHQKSILSMFDRTKLSEDELKEQMEKETFLYAEDAVKCGYFDEVYDARPAMAALNAFPVENIPPEMMTSIKSNCVGTTYNLHGLYARKTFLQKQSS